jgi:two-component system response regulator NreC
MSETEKTSVLIADDHAVVRSGLRMILEAEAGMEIVAEAESVDGAIRKLKAYKPAVLVLDINMGGISSLDSMSEMREASPETRIIVLTMQTETAYARDALRGGASGYLLKDAADTDLVEAVTAAARGERYVQPSIGARLAAEQPPEWPPDGLSDREAEVLRLIALGLTNREIGEELYLSIRTVESHRAHIQQKLRLHTRKELVAYALEHDMVNAAPPPVRSRAGA